MTVQTDLLATPPNMLQGVHQGAEWETQYPGLRFFVQVAGTVPGSVLPFTLGSSTLGGPQWFDMTPDIQGLAWERGGEPSHRPIAGEATWRIMNVMDKWSPWSNSYFGPGAVIRILSYDGTTMSYHFVGLVQSWQDASAGLESYQWIDIIAWEPQFLLNGVDDNALVTPIGGGEGLAARIDRLLTHADWVFQDADVVTAVSPPATFQATDLAKDVATEIYLTVDSVDAVYWSGKDGTPKVRDRNPASVTTWTIDRGSQDPDSNRYENDDERLLSRVALARVGGTEVVFTNATIANRYQKRSTKRDDLITIAEASNADLQRVADGILGRADQTYRPSAFSMVATQSALARQLMMEYDINDRVDLERLVADGRQLIFSQYALCKVDIQVQVRLDGTHWTGTFSLDIEVDSSWAFA